MKDKKYLLEHFAIDQILQIYYDMVLVRRFEERCSSAYGQRMISGFCHLYIGQEASIVGTKYAITPQDSTITSYRCHGHAILFGQHPKFVMAELFGKSTGSSGGKGGSMHLFAPDNKFYGGHGIVGAQVPIGTGLAFAEKYNNTNNISVTFMGDGAVNQGQVYESFNMAALWGLPVLYIVENNFYAMGTSCARHSASGVDFSQRGKPWNIDGKIVDGMSFINVHRAVKAAAEIVRKGKPYLLQIDTYRYRGHSMSDPAKYRSNDEVKKYKETDPILNFRSIIESIIDNQDIQATEDRAMNIVNESYEFAVSSEFPSSLELGTNVV